MGRSTQARRRRPRGSGFTSSGASNIVVALLLQLGLADASFIAREADSLGVPPVVALHVAEAETGPGTLGNAYRGPGVLTYDSLGTPHRVCREVGRFQLKPCHSWTFLSPTCTREAIRLHYAVNVQCGLLFLRYLRTRYGNWPDAIEHYNGSPVYRDRILAGIGRDFLHTVDP